MHGALTVNVPVFVINCVVAFFNFHCVSTLPRCAPRVCRLFFACYSVGIMVVAVPVFVLTGGTRVHSRHVQGTLTGLALYNFNVCVIRCFLTKPSMLLVETLGIPVDVRVPLTTIITFYVS